MRAIRPGIAFSPQIRRLRLWRQSRFDGRAFPHFDDVTLVGRFPVAEFAVQ